MSDESLEYHEVATTGDVAEGEGLQVMIGRNEIAIFNVEGEFFATDDICSHAYASMSDGYIDGDQVECPLHGACFNIKTGKALTPPATEDLKTYALKIEGDKIFVGMPKSD